MLIFIVADESGSDSDHEGAPKSLDESTLLNEIRLARERMAEQTHPHENRAKSVLDMMRGATNQSQADTTEHAGRSGGGNRKRKDDHENEARALKKVWFNEVERGNGSPVNMRREAYDPLEQSHDTMTKSESCPYGCNYSSMDVELVKAHLYRCPNRNKTNSGETGEITSMFPK